VAEARAEGIRFAAVNPNRRHHLDGQPQNVLLLDAHVQASGEQLEREVQELAEQPAPG